MKQFGSIIWKVMRWGRWKISFFLFFSFRAQENLSGFQRPCTGGIFLLILNLMNVQTMSIEPIKRRINWTQLNAIEWLRFDCRTQSKLNQILTRICCSIIECNRINRIHAFFYKNSVLWLRVSIILIFLLF